MRGHIVRRGRKSWRLKFDVGRDPETGKRLIHYVTVRGKRADAERELRKQLSQIDKGIIIEPTKATVAEYLDTWLDDVAPDSVGPKALERYRGLARNQIKPTLGTIQLQRLRPRDIKRWHRELISAGKISTRTIRHAHGVLQKALADAAAVEIVERNVASIIKPPKVKDTEKKKMVILTEKEAPDTLQKLEGH